MSYFLKSSGHITAIGVLASFTIGSTYNNHRRDTTQYSSFLSEVETSARRWIMFVSPECNPCCNPCCNPLTVKNRPNTIIAKATILMWRFRLFFVQRRMS